MALLVANLDCEGSWSGGAAPGTAVRARIAALGTAMRAFAHPGDRLWTPVPVDPRRLPAIPGVPPVTLTCGPLDPGAGPVLPWGQTDEVAAGASDRPPPFGPVADPAVARRCNEHGFAWTLAARRGWLLPGARAVTSVAELEAHLAAGGAEAGAGAWVARAPWSASGRERLRRRGALDGASRTRLERLLAGHQRLYFEPWVERLADAGCCGFVAGNGRVELRPVHGLDNDPGGVFRGISIGATPGLEPGEVERIAEAAAAAGAHLAAVGYRGPFGIDAYVWSDGASRRLQPMSEINARLSFGWVAGALARRALPGAEAVSFAVRVASAGSPVQLMAGEIEILRPGAPDGVCAVLGRCRPASR